MYKGACAIDLHSVRQRISYSTKPSPCVAITDIRCAFAWHLEFLVAYDINGLQCVAKRFARHTSWAVVRLWALFAVGLVMCFFWPVWRYRDQKPGLTKAESAHVEQKETVICVKSLCLWCACQGVCIFSWSLMSWHKGIKRVPDECRLGCLRGRRYSLWHPERSITQGS